MAQSLCYATAMIEAGRQVSGHLKTAVRFTVVGLLFCFMVPVSGMQGSDDPEPRVFQSLVIPSEYPFSPHAWPAGEPIWIECWGDEADRRQARDLALYRRKRDRLENALKVAEAVANHERALLVNWVGRATPSELADQKAAYEVAQAEVERLQEERESLTPLALALTRGWRDGNQRHPLSVITFRTANGTRYGWNPEWNPERESEDVPMHADVEDVFPHNPGLPELETFFAAQERLKQAFTTGDAAAVTSASTALDETEDALEALDRANALSDAIELDALESCAR